jgi:hypothetical protein
MSHVRLIRCLVPRDRSSATVVAEDSVSTRPYMHINLQPTHEQHVVLRLVCALLMYVMAHGRTLLNDATSFERQTSRSSGHRN